MKPTYTTITHEGTVDTDGRVRMGFDAGSIAHLMAILTDLYSDPELAVIREYSLNALDSHCAAGVSDPVVVTLPTPLFPTYTVKDVGVGLSVDDVVGHLTQYGWSSKRETDNEVGMLGLGFKAGLTYTSQFTLVARKHGVEATVLVTRDDDGAGAVQIIDTRSTNEPDGVEVNIPVKNVEWFNQRAEKFFRFWEPGTVLVDDEPVASHWESNDVLRLDPDVLIATDLDSDFIVMGNVAYPCGRKISDSNHFQVICRVAIGTVDFVPSREALQYTARTNEVVSEAREFVRRRVLEVAQASIDAAETASEALLRSKRWYTAMPRHRFTYFGRVIPRDITGPMLNWDTGQSWRYNTRTGTHDYPAKKAHSCSVETALEALHVVGVKGAGISSKIKGAIRTYIATEAIDAKHVLFSEDPLGLPWLDGLAKTVHIDTIKARMPKPEKAERIPRPKGSYKVLSEYGVNFVPELPEGQYVWMGTTEFVNKTEIFYALNARNVRILLVDANRLDKFRQSNPNIQHVKEFATAEVARRVEGITAENAVAMHFESDWEDTGLNVLSSGDVIDGQLASILALFEASGDDVWYNWNIATNLSAVFRLPQPELPEADSSIPGRIEAVKAKYPVVERLSHRLENHEILDYVNAIHFYKVNNAR